MPCSGCRDCQAPPFSAVEQRAHADSGRVRKPCASVGVLAAAAFHRAAWACPWGFASCGPAAAWPAGCGGRSPLQCLFLNPRCLVQPVVHGCLLNTNPRPGCGHLLNAPLKTCLGICGELSTGSLLRKPLQSLAITAIWIMHDMCTTHGYQYLQFIAFLIFSIISKIGLPLSSAGLGILGWT